MEIVAEIGSVHDGSFGNALKLIELAATSGATVAKFQLHIPEVESTVDAPSPSYFENESRYSYFQRTKFDLNQWGILREHCHKNGIKFGCSAFSIESVDMLAKIGVDVIKIPSGEVSNVPLLRYLSSLKLGIPIHISSGMSTWHELDGAISILSTDQLSVLQCTSKYPPSPAEIGLNNIGLMISRYGIPVGFSDHSLGIEMSIAAVALGAVIIEKHITFSRLMYGSDAFNALEPGEFRHMCESIKNVRNAVLHPYNKDSAIELIEMRKTFQKGIYSKVALRKGEYISAEKLLFLKPERGIPAREIDSVIGKRVSKDLPASMPIEFGDLT